MRLKHATRKAKHGLPLLFILFVFLATGISSFAASSITINSTGEVTDIVLGDVNRFQNANNQGFFILETATSTRSRPQSVVTTGNTHVITATGGSPVFTLRIDDYANHLSFHLTDVQGVVEDEWVLELDIKTNGLVGAKEFNDLTSATFSTSSSILRADFLYPGTELHYGSHGGFAIWNDDLSDTARDQVMAEVWSYESNDDMPKPLGKSNWTPTEVLT